MTGLVLCGLAGLASFVAGYRSRNAGLMLVLGVGYVYGITRANVGGPFAHFVFDAALVGLYLSELLRRSPAAERARMRPLRIWVALLLSWPLLLFLVPAQHPLIQLVGLRGFVFFLPFLLLGGRTTGEDLYRVGLWVAALNVAVFIVATLEFFLGVEAFFPASEVTRTIMNSTDVAGGEHRIPATFSNAHSYAGTMVMSIPLLAGAWTQRHRRAWHQHLLVLGLAAAALGIFMAATRTNMVLLALLLLTAMFTGQVRSGVRAGWVLMAIGIGWVVAREERLQRFETLQETGYVSERIGSSVNEGFFDVLVRYPLGNGLGGGGTSLPFFLEPLVRNRIWIENEYARILLELGIPGLILWVAFFAWALSRRTTRRGDPWYLGRRLAWVVCAAYVLLGLMGTGLLTAIPQTVLFLFYLGWISRREHEPDGAYIPLRVRMFAAAPRP